MNYITKDGRVLFVTHIQKWRTCWKDAENIFHLVQSPGLPPRDTRTAALADLGAYAKAKGLEAVL